jgi:threonine dehydrogenase-like Zn-dependent dehydrogenase
VKISSTAICGSDLHLYDGYIPAMKTGDILGHEFMGEVVEVGRGVGNLAVGDRVVVPFPIACGACHACEREMYSLCENSNPNAVMAETLFGHPAAGIFGYSHLTGGFAGGQAEYARVPFADVGPLKIESDLSDEQVLFLSDILPTAYMGAEFCDIKPGHVVAVWGARQHTGAETINYEDVDVNDALKEMTGGRGPDACIDCVGMEAHHGTGLLDVYGKVKQAVRLETERTHALRQAITCCRNGGVVSIMGVYGGFADKFPLGSLMQRGLTIRTGQCHVHRYMRPLLELIERGEIDPTFIITHRLGLDDAPKAYETFKHKQDDCVKVVLSP